MTSFDHITIEGRQLRHPYICTFLLIFTFGLYHFLTKLIPKIKLLETRKCNLRDSTHLKINNKIVKIEYFVFPYYTTKLKNFVKNKEIRFFEFNFIRFFYDITKHKFVLYKDEEFKAHLTKLVKSQEESNKMIMKELSAKYKQKKFGFKKKYTVTKMFEEFFFTDISLLEKYIVYGENSTEQKQKGNIRILLDILISPIFLYTMAGVILWFNIDYEFNACIIIALTGYSLVIDYMEEIRKKKEIEKISHKKDVSVQRNGSWMTVPHTAIFPGDIIGVEAGSDFVCDARLVKGEVIVDESFLSGETVPVFKNSDSSNNIVYAGTTVMKTLGVRTVHERKNIIPDASQLQSEVKVKSIKKKNLKNDDARKIKTLGISAGNDVYSTSSKDKQARRLADLPSNSENEEVSHIEANNSEDALHTSQNQSCNSEFELEIQTGDNCLSPSGHKLKSQAYSEITSKHKKGNDCTIDSKRVSKNDSRAIGVVVSTRFDTAKGRLVKNILIETPVDFLFEKQCMQTIIRTLIAAAVFITILFIYLFCKGLSFKDTFCYSIDLVFCIMSPTLPATIWIGSTLAAQRLRKQKIRCNEAQKINLAGKSDIVVFDKTGTLTEEGLDVYCIDDIEREYYDLCDITNGVESVRDDVSEASSNLETMVSIYNNVEEQEMKFDNNGASNDSDKTNNASPCSITRCTSPGNTIKVNKNLSNIRECLSVCHSVYLVDDEMVGDPLDIKMFLFAESRIVNENGKRMIVNGSSAAYEGPILKDERGNEPSLYYYQGKTADIGQSEGIEVVKIFEFDNKLRRMSVIMKKTNGRGYKVFVKGSPESLHALFREVPDDYEDTVKDHALDGFRVLALAYKEVENCDIERNEAESNLTFIGLIVFANKLKSETKGTLKELNKVGIKTLMATGDNILTAVSVGRQAKIIDKFTPVIFPLIDENAKSIYDAQWLCIGEDGLVFDKIKLSLHKGEDRISYSDFFVACEGREYEAIRQESKEYFDFLLSRGVIFARMNPDQKKLLMEDLNNIGYSTVFCGDGANDCGALKSAHVGIALAENEASIASTFISTVKNISCVLSVIKEGRCALVTSYSRFQYMLLTCYIQFISLYILSFIMLFLSDKQCAHFDILIVLPFAYFMTEFKPNTELSRNIPKFNLFARKEAIRVAGHIVIDTIFIGLGIVCAKCFESNWIMTDPLSFAKDSPTSLYVFFITSLQVIVLGYLFSTGKPHRQSRISNKKYMAFFAITTMLLLALLGIALVDYQGYLYKAYQFVEISNFSRIAICGILIVNTLISIVFDKYTRTENKDDPGDDENVRSN